MYITDIFWKLNEFRVRFHKANNISFISMVCFPYIWGTSVYTDQWFLLDQSLSCFEHPNRNMSSSMYANTFCLKSLYLLPAYLPEVPCSKGTKSLTQNSTNQNIFLCLKTDVLWCEYPFFWNTLLYSLTVRALYNQTGFNICPKVKSLYSIVNCFFSFN